MYKRLVLSRHDGKKEFLLLLSAFLLLVLALARPVYLKSDSQSANMQTKIAIAVDISKSMLCRDVYPDRLAFAKHKILALLQQLDRQKVALLAFANQPFIISPLSSDYAALEGFVQNLHPKSKQQNGTDILKALEAANTLLGKSNPKAVALFTDGGEDGDFSAAIDYAQANDLSVFVYHIGTEKGGAIEENGAYIKNAQGNIVITARNDRIKKLAARSGGGYLPYTLSDTDTKAFVATLTQQFHSAEQLTGDAKNSVELYFIPLLLALLLLLVARVHLKGF